MKIVSWNCLKGLKSEVKLAFIESLSPDILILQESKKNDFKEAHFRHWFANKDIGKDTLGLGIYVFNKSISVQALKRNSDFELIQPFSVSIGSTSFELVCVWAFNKRSVGRYRNKRGMMSDALDFYKTYLNENSCWIGDFNNGPEIAKGVYWTPVTEKFTQASLRKLSFKGKVATHFHNSGKRFEIDHCFMGNELVSKTSTEPRLTAENVPSDHLPLVMDIIF